jgi:peptide/nickel transport system permease protein
MSADPIAAVGIARARAAARAERQSSRDAFRAQVSRRWRRLVGQPLGVMGLAIVALLLVCAAFAPWIAPYDPLAQSLDGRLMPPSAAHWFGTDEVGRDVLSRLVFGTRITVLIVTMVAVIAAPVGLLFGATAGYLGGWADVVLMRLTDIFLSLPGLILALAFVTALGPGLENSVIAIALTIWPPIARLARAETLTVRGADYINAMRVQGASTARIIFRHVMPMCVPSVIIRITLNMAGIILTAAGLGFLGLGAQPPSPEWGSMLATARQYMTGHWWVATIPGSAILVVSLGFNLLGDALRDALDPRAP